MKKEKAVERVARLYNNGSSAKAISTKLNLANSTVQNYLTKARKDGMVTAYSYGKRRKSAKSILSDTNARKYDMAAIANGLRSLADAIDAKA